MNFSEVLFSFDGRINRAKYWLAQFIFAILGIVVSLLVILTAELAIVLWVIYSIVIIWPALAVAVKRWHDRNKSGWWIFIVLIPIIGSIWSFIELGCLKGTDGPNDYGEDPLENA